MWAASGGLYDVPACGAGTAGRVIAVRGWGTSGACVRETHGISIRARILGRSGAHLDFSLDVLRCLCRPHVVLPAFFHGF